MRLLADLCIARDTILGLRFDGHDVLSLAEAKLNPTDEQILALAKDQSRIVLTEDADFGTHIFHDGLESPGVVRVEQLRPAEQLATVRAILSLHEAPLLQGALVTARRNRIRVAQRS
jgi:predicted nuclease of predicted toxin-antitoxin system